MSTLAPVFAALPAKPDHDALERSILELWERDQTFRRLREMNDGGPRFSFIDGPVTANKNLGVHTAWGRTLKDVFQRYKALRGYHQRYQNGFDCQGLWIEVGVERELGLNSKREIEEYGLAQFAKKCRDVVVRSSTALTEGSIRLGQWMDWGRDYFTFSDTNIEHIWRFLQLMHERGWLYRGHRATEWCPRCGTSISGHELAGSYANRLDPSVQVRLPLKERPDEALRVWTTTPWTLPANVAAAVRPDATYGRLQDGDWVAVDLFPNETFREVRLGRELVGWQYEGPFDTLSPGADTEHRVIPWEDVSLDEGTGIVHLAPGCGVEDFELAKAEALPLLMPVDESGRFLHEYGWLAGLSTNEALEPILKDLQRRNRLAQVSTIDHRYPECWRCHTPLIYRVSDDWFIAVDGLREQLRAVNERIKWIPEYMGKRMDDWLLNMKDWNISRRRYYGLPLPFYPCACGQLTVIGSRSELKTRATRSLDHLEELHRPWIDAVRIHCDGCGGEIQRVPEVGDVWLDAGIVPFSTLGWQNPESVPQGFATGAARGLTTADLPDHSHWEKWFPADWVCEMREQIRLWFYSQLFISVALTGKAPFRTVLGYEKMLDEHGREMHGSWGNMISADDAFARLGADVMRWQYCMQPPNKNLLFGFDRGSEIQRKFLTLWNSASFLIQYANLASFRPVCEDASREAVDESLAPLDRWLVARARQLVSQASEAYENYSTLDVIRASERFIDDMSNWYIRRSRRRFWDGDHVALQTLWYGLVQLIRTIAPITPFIAEHLWQTLVRNACREAPISVFLAGWPNILSPDQHLLEDIAEVRRVVELGRKARMRSRLRTRQPLPRIVVEGPARISRYAEEIADELRVKQTEFGSIRASKLVVRPNLRRLGPRLGSQVRRVQAALDAGDFEQLAEGRYRAAGVELEASDVVEEWVTVEGWVVESAGNITVALDATLDDELRREGRVYDLIHLVNAMRREARLAITDRIALTLPERDADLLLHREWIMAETLARSLQVDAVEEPTIVEVSSESVKDEAVDGMRNCGAPRR